MMPAAASGSFVPTRCSTIAAGPGPPVAGCAAMKVFLSWSGQPARELAAYLREWLPRVIQSLKPWMSDEDIGKGNRWSSAVAAQLNESQFGIIVVTPDN